MIFEQLHVVLCVFPTRFMGIKNIQNDKLTRRDTQAQPDASGGNVSEDDYVISEPSDLYNFKPHSNNMLRV